MLSTIFISSLKPVLIAATVTASPHAITIPPGATLSGLAAQYGTTVSALAGANGIADPNMIIAGNRLVIGGAGQGIAGASPGDHDGDGDDSAAAPAASQAGQPAAPAPAVSAPSAGGGFEACVIQRESGGSATAVNSSSGAGGLYGFMPSTWASLGFSGLPENASVATQNAAFQKEFAIAGTSPWAPYDGC
jgi:LysM repeat protein